MHKIQINVTREQFKKLDKIYEETGARRAETVRRALDKYFKEYEKNKKSI